MSLRTVFFSYSRPSRKTKIPRIPRQLRRATSLFQRKAQRASSYLRPIKEKGGRNRQTTRCRQQVKTRLIEKDAWTLSRPSSLLLSCPCPKACPRTDQLLPVSPTHSFSYRLAAARKAISILPLIARKSYAKQSCSRVRKSWFFFHRQKKTGFLSPTKSTKRLASRKSSSLHERTR